MRLDHFNISVPRELLDQVRDFYRDVLGFEQGERPDFSRRGYWLYSEGCPYVHLIESDDHVRYEQPGYLDHVAFRSSGLGSMTDRLENAGMTYRKSYIPEFNMTQLFFHDPSGTRLEINFPGERS